MHPVTSAANRLTELWQEHLPALVLFAMRRAPSREDAMDVVAEVYLVAWRRIDRVPAGHEARLWLFTVARNVLANQRRGALRRTSLSLRLANEVEMTTPDSMDATVTQIAVRDALATLPERSRELLMLVAHDGLSPSEAAQVLGIPAATARVRLHRARTQMRAAMKRCELAGHVRADGPPGVVCAEIAEVI